MALLKHQPRAMTHPLADDERLDGQLRRVTLRHSVAQESSDQRLCEAANRILRGLQHRRLAAATRVDRDAEGRLVLSYPNDDLHPASLYLGSKDAGFIATVLEGVCEALDAAHGMGVFHGALTPCAVRIRSTTTPPVVEVSDFGVGHLFGINAALDDHPSWLPCSPEKQQGLEPTPAEDVYLVGALGFALLAGRPLFEGGSHHQLLHKHASKPADGEFANAPECEDWLGSILRQCLRKEPNERPASLCSSMMTISSKSSNRRR